MIKKIIALPGLFYRSTLKLIGAIVTFSFVFYMHVSGQTTQDNRNVPDSTGTKNNEPNSSDTHSVKYIPSDDVIALYGMPYVEYIKGTIRDNKNNAGVPNIQVSIADSMTKQPLKTTITQANGSYSFTFTGSAAVPNSFIISMRDIDGESNGEFDDKDTLISSANINTSALDINISEKHKTGIKLNTYSTGKRVHNVDVQNSNDRILVRYSLDKQSTIAINLFSIDGKLIRRISDGYQRVGTHTATIEPSCLAIGTYLLQIQTDSDIAVSKVHIGR